MKDKAIAGIIILSALLVIFLWGGALWRIYEINSNPLKNVLAWESYQVKESNTKVWCLARNIARDKYDTRDVVELIAEKNPGLRKKGFDLQIGDEILLPVFKEKTIASRGFLSVKKCVEKDKTGEPLKYEIITPGE